MEPFAAPARRPAFVGAHDFTPVGRNPHAWPEAPMADVRRSEEPTPGGRAPAGPLYVPVRPERRCSMTRFLRAPGGRRTAVAFTACARLPATLGRDHPWIRLSVTALRSLTSPLGCTTITIDPQSSAPPGRTPSAPVRTPAEACRGTAGPMNGTRPSRGEGSVRDEHGG